MYDEITLCISSCGRLHLLEQTLESISQFNTYPIVKSIIIDDSGKEQNWDPIVELLDEISDSHEIIINEKIYRHILKCCTGTTIILYLNLHLGFQHQQVFVLVVKDRVEACTAKGSG